MAVELKKFQAELTVLESEVASVFGNRKMLGDSEGNLKKLLEGAKLAIGDRAGQLKAEGKPAGKTKGFVIEDFASDPEVKKALDVAKDALSNYKAMEAKKIDNATKVKAVYTKYLDLAKRIDAEIADRKKKMFEPKSLPAMIDLSKKIHKETDESNSLTSESIRDAAMGIQPKVGGVEAAFKTDLQVELNKPATMRANPAASALLEKFKPRILKLRSDRVRTLEKTVDTACKAALAAKAKPDVAAAKAQLKIAEDAALELSGIATDFGEAYNKNKTFVAQNPDHDTIFKAVSEMATSNNKSLKAISATQAALK